MSVSYSFVQCGFYTTAVYKPYYISCSETHGLIWASFWRIFNPWSNQAVVVECCSLWQLGLGGIHNVLLQVSRRGSARS